MQATHTAELDLPNLPAAARTAHIFPDLGTTSLLSVGQLCDANCTATFTNTEVTITHDGNKIITGKCTKDSNLWQVTLNHEKQKPSTKPDTTMHTIEQSAHNVNHTQKAAEIVAFAHGALFSPALSTLQKALAKNYINNFPGLTEQTLRQHPPRSIAMVKGHLDQSRQNQ